MKAQGRWRADGRPADIQEEAFIATATALGPHGTVLLPDLQKSLPKNPRCARAILSIDPGQGPAAVRALIEAVGNGGATWNDVAGLAVEIGPAALPAVSQLIKGLPYGDEFQRALIAIGPAAVPALAAALARDDDDLVIRARAAETLGLMGPSATAAVPALQKLLEDPDEEVHRETEKALRRISAGDGRAPGSF
jgi:HEAT repeat protein